MTLCLRGVRQAKYVVDGRVHAGAFDPVHNPPERREDGYLEASINFEDDICSYLSLSKDSSNAGYGVARFHVEAIERANLAIISKKGVVTIERKPLLRNKYHGNVLYSGALDKLERIAIAAVLAANSEYINKQMLDANAALCKEARKDLSDKLSPAEAAPPNDRTG